LDQPATLRKQLFNKPNIHLSTDQYAKGDDPPAGLTTGRRTEP